jgi:hypothetical protein
MTGMFSPLVRLWSTLKAGHVPLPEVKTLSPDRCLPANSAGYPILRDKMYFEIRVNQLYLAENRKWWAEFDPLVVVVVEFSYGNGHAVLPVIIGPNLIRRQSNSDQALHGVVLQDVRVIGPHPYRGGDVDLSVSFYKVERTNHAAGLLKVIDELSATLGAPGEMLVAAKVGGALLQGVESLLGMKESIYLSGHRLSLAPSPLDPMKASFSALVVPPVQADMSSLCVRDRRLFLQDAPYTASDFVLLSVSGKTERGDENMLPFYSLKTEGLAAIFDGDEGLKRGKALLLSGYQQMRKGPDVTKEEAGRLFEDWANEFEVEKKRLERMRSMPANERKKVPGSDDGELDDAVRRLAF